MCKGQLVHVLSEFHYQLGLDKHGVYLWGSQVSEQVSINKSSGSNALVNKDELLARIVGLNVRYLMRIPGTAPESGESK